MFKRNLKNAGLGRRIWQFNEAERDSWVAARAAEIPAGSRVLDVGAGPCTYRPLFAHCEYRSHDFAVLDSSQLPAGYGQIDYISDIAAIPAEDGSFDVILCTEVLEHVPAPLDAIREMARLLKPGGRLLLTAPLGSGIHQQPYHFVGGYTPYWYERFLGEAGFEAIHVEANGGFFKHFGQESVRFAQMTAPWRAARSRVAQILLLPVWAVAAGVLVGVVPPLCHALDPLDRNRHFTTGYHVTAVRKRVG